MKRPNCILVIDDDEAILASLKFYLSRHFQHVSTEHNPYHIPRHLRNRKYDVILMDMNFRPGKSDGEEGMEWLKKIKTLQQEAKIIIITAFADIPLAVEAVKEGAFDFIEKPWKNEQLLSKIIKAIEQKITREKKPDIQKNMLFSVGKIIGSSPEMRQVLKLIEKVAATDVNILILGENGTGKELIAAHIHRQSLRKNNNFVSVDLGAIPDTLFESELFGHKKGAFTDAKMDRIGRFEAAKGGTLFLDEIGNLPYPLQAKLLTAIQSRNIQRLGTNDNISIDIRLITATNMPLHKMVKEKSFRQDLLYRINTVEIKLPPLREREGDIPFLCEYFLDIYTKKYNKEGVSIADSALQTLEEYPWPGNIRELQHAVERAIILSENKILKTADFVLQKNDEPADGHTLFEEYNLDVIEKWAIQRALAKHRANITQTAKELGLTRTAMYRRMEKHGL